MKGMAHMKKIMVITIGLVLVSFLVLGTMNVEEGSREQNQVVIEKDIPFDIQNATVLIEMQLPNLEQPLDDNLFLGYGIGTLIQVNGQTFLITHNHWREILEDITIVRFYDADHKLVKAIIGKEYRELILHADSGTQILQPPPELVDNLMPVNVDILGQISVGESVEVVCWDKSTRDKADIQQAVIEEISTYNGVPVYKLRNLEGEPIQPGDSGGGVWHKGVLVGNNWMVEANSNGSNVETTRVYTDVSYAAALSVDIPLGR
jgi:hypothetical protein